jgi:hypothetical protein
MLSCALPSPNSYLTWASPMDDEFAIAINLDFTGEYPV